jgi:hypothetical protein
MAKKLSTWNLFVKKIYAEGKAKNANYAFKDALKEASKRKGEMKMGASSEGSSAETKSRKRGTKKRGSRKAKSKTSKKR